MSTKESLKTRIIKKAWEDPTFRRKLLEDPKSAILNAFENLMPKSLELVAVEGKANKFYLVIPSNPIEVLAGAPQPAARW